MGVFAGADSGHYEGYSDALGFSGLCDDWLVSLFVGDRCYAWVSGNSKLIGFLCYW